ncbi:ferrous iron transport protein B [Desulfonauticus submarinus]|uniref:Ferrous iron transport protein B n=1 Tax=Desulfonauticus submarinus TaxID=206665 RepID=A0A1H0BUX1_9BACT|nr:ferrous iron transport protein B [Desulfonauticus submarinus]SDN49398.1 ferrous iron transport protein B [Desulfonauticus submarinus]
MPQQIIKVALAGNPNSGKTTLFNALTGARQQVGNYPGITVEKKEGFLNIDDFSIHFVDLPGTYSLTAYSQEELVARNFLIQERPDLVVDVINASSLERNLYLAIQILELGAPLILVLNMMDEVRAQGININSPLLSKRLGVPVVETVARHGLGKKMLVQTILKEAKKKPSWTPLILSYGPDLDPALEKMVTAIKQENNNAFPYPPHWLALKILENDEEIKGIILKENPKLYKKLDQIYQEVSAHCEKTLNTYPEAIIADYRYGFISSLLKDVVQKNTHAERIAVSDKIDKILTHKFIGPLLMFGVLYAVYKLTFSLGEYPLTWVSNLFDFLANTVNNILPDGLLKSLIVSGIIGGVGGVVSFVPLIALMFLFLSFLEDSGYMARVAYMLDRVFRIFGLHGSSIMPFIISGGIAGGCAVPGVMAARTLRSPKEKLATILTVPFMTCGAKLPLFILLTGTFFPQNKASILFLISMLGWVVALLVAKILRSTIIRGPATPFVMELPPYRLPTWQGLFIHSWEKTWLYLKKAGTVILAISILIWALMTFPTLPKQKINFYQKQIDQIQSQISRLKKSNPLNDKIKTLLAQQQKLKNKLQNEQLTNSFAGRIGQALEKVTILAGFDWKTNIALIGGFAAKEVIVSTLGTAYSLGGNADNSVSLAEKLKNDPSWNTAKALALMVFVLLYAPCMVTIVTIAKEESWKWAGFSLIFNTIVAFILAILTYNVFS